MKSIRKIICCLLIIAMAISLVACGGQNSTVSSDTTTTKASDTSSVSEADNDGSHNSSEETAKILVIYFSHTGNTKPVAEYIHNTVGGDIVEIIPVDEYPAGYSDALDPAKQEQRENARPAIKNTIENFEKYDTVYLGYPIWWGTVPMIINTLLETYDFSGKTVIPFCTSGGTGIQQSVKDIKSEIPNATVLDGLRVTGNDEIIPWLQGLGISISN